MRWLKILDIATRVVVVCALLVFGLSVSRFGESLGRIDKNFAQLNGAFAGEQERQEQVRQRNLQKEAAVWRGLGKELGAKHQGARTPEEHYFDEVYGRQGQAAR